MYLVKFWAHNWLPLYLHNSIVRTVLNGIYGRVIDLGCGNRPYEKEIVLRDCEYIGVDWDGTYHNKCADISSDLNKKIEIEDEYADAIVCFQVLEHLHEPMTMLKEANRILRKGGRMVLSVPFQWGVHEEPYDYFRYTNYGLVSILEKSGFKNIEVFPFGGFWTTIVLKINYQSTRLVRGGYMSKKIISLVFLPFWLISQLVAFFLDKFWQCPQEATGYFALAKK